MTDRATVLHHYTINTGDLSRTRRKDVLDLVIDHLTPLIDNGGGPLPSLAGWHLHTEPLPGASERGGQRGARYFQVADETGLSRRPIIMAVACWQEDARASAWNTVRFLHANLSAPASGMRWPLCDQPPLPWLAVCITPFAALASADLMQMLGDLERCLAWAMIEVVS